MDGSEAPFIKAMKHIQVLHQRNCCGLIHWQCLSAVCDQSQIMEKKIIILNDSWVFKYQSIWRRYLLCFTKRLSGYLSLCWLVSINDLIKRSQALWSTLIWLFVCVVFIIRCRPFEYPSVGDQGRWMTFHISITEVFIIWKINLKLRRFIQFSCNMGEIWIIVIS